MPPFTRVHHVCVVVEDLDRAVAFYESVGIGPWRAYPPLAEYATLDAPDADAFRRLRVRVAAVGDLDLQLLEPGAGDTPQRAFLDARGPGVYHVGFAVDDADVAEREATALGLRPGVRGRRADGSGFTYYDTRDAAGVVLETRQSPRDGG